MITCDEFFAEFGDYLEDRVSPNVRTELERHLSQFRACHVLYDSTCQTVKIVTDSGSFNLPENVSESTIGQVMAKLRADRAYQHLTETALSRAQKEDGMYFPRFFSLPLPASPPYSGSEQ
jgi:hypothetical protein